MEVKYLYKNETFDDIRDILLNNKMEPNYDFIYHEYLPFQLSLSYETPFEGVYLHPTSLFCETTDYSNLGFNTLFNCGIMDYLLVKGIDIFDLKDTAIALSGGADSGILARTLKPSVAYTGVMHPVMEAGLREVSTARTVAKEIDAEHRLYDVTEDDFINTVEDVVEATGFHLGGFGGPVDLFLMKRIIQDKPSTKAVIYGYGGDEVFLGYPWNFTVLGFKYAGQKNEFSGYLDSRSALADRMEPLIIMSALYRGPDSDYLDEMNESWGSISVLSNVQGSLNRVLYANINYLLPSFLHVMNQFGRFCKVKMLNPLANSTFISNAVGFNMPLPRRPKDRILSQDEEYIKYGNPIPMKAWSKVDEYIKELYTACSRRFPNTAPEYPGLCRMSWGYAMIELCFRKFIK